MNDSVEEFDAPPISIAIPGLDDILRGGLPPHCLYLVSGTPGTGKTTLALQFLLDTGWLCSLYAPDAHSPQAIVRM